MDLADRIDDRDQVGQRLQHPLDLAVGVVAHMARRGAFERLQSRSQLLGLQRADEKAGGAGVDRHHNPRRLVRIGDDPDRDIVGRWMRADLPAQLRAPGVSAGDVIDDHEAVGLFRKTRQR